MTTHPTPAPAPKPGTCPGPCAWCHLRKTEAFTEVTVEDLAFLEAFRTGTTSLERGDALIPEFRTGEKLYTLYSGWAFRYKTLSDGRRQILNFLLPGDFIGLQEEFADQYTHGVEALTDVTLCEFPRERLWELFRTRPQMGYDITWLAAREEQLVDENLLTAGRRNAMERVAMLLIHMFRRAERVGLRDPATGAVDFPLQQQHMADALGLSLVHTNKTLRALYRLGLHDIQDGRLRILNAKALLRIAEWAERPMRRVPLI